jgi:hypothetical protein
MHLINKKICPQKIKIPHFYNVKITKNFKTHNFMTVHRCNKTTQDGKQGELDMSQDIGYLGMH